MDTITVDPGPEPAIGLHPRDALAVNRLSIEIPDGKAKRAYCNR
jgi:hypothetical protein